jgi:tetratricopeptide (TPR) repeat protein
MAKAKAKSKSIKKTNKGDSASFTDFCALSKRFFSEFIKNYDVILVFLLFFAVYNTVTSLRMSGDTLPAQLIPFSLLKDHTIYLDSFVTSFNNQENAYAFVHVNGHFVSLFPIVTPILILPLYFISYTFIALFSIPIDFFVFGPMARTAAACIAALAGMVIYKISREIFSKKIALFVAFIFAFATGTWSISSQSLWQHGMSELLVALLIYIIILNEKHESTKYIIYLGILSGLLLFNRPPDAILIIPVLIYVIMYYKKSIFNYFISALLSGLPFLLYNFIFFGNPFGGYNENLGLFVVNVEAIPHFIGLIIAPNTGILIFSPVLIISFFGYLYLFKLDFSRLNRFLIWFGPVFLINVLIYSFFWGWFTSAYCYGQRYLTSIVPILVIYIGIFLNNTQNIFKKDFFEKISWVLCIVLVILSVLIQFTGTFLYPFIDDASMDSTRAWYWNNSLILRSADEGLSKIDSITFQSFPPFPPFFTLQINQYRYYNQQGMKLISKNKSEEAIPLFDKALAINPDYAEAYYDKGVALNNLGKFEEAIPLFDKSLELDPIYVMAYCEKGISLNNLKKYEEAISLFDKGISIDNYSINCWKNKGISFVFQKKSYEALTSFNAVLILDPQDVDGWRGKGLIFGIEGKYREALDAFNQVLILDPNDKIAYQNKENLLNILRNISKNHQIE